MCISIYENGLSFVKEKHIYKINVLQSLLKREQSATMTSFGFPLQFDKNVSYVIATFLTPKQYKFLDWIDQTKLNWETLSSWVDESILKKNSNKIYWLNVPANENAPSLVYDLFENRNNFYQKVEDNLLQQRPTMYKDIQGYKRCMNIALWIRLNFNSSDVAIKILLKHANKIKWDVLSHNSHPIAISMLSQNQHKIDWSNLCCNSGAIHLLKDKTKDFTTNLDLIDRYNLCTNPAAINIIEKHTHLINLIGLSSNPLAIHMLPQFVGLYKNNLCVNPSAIDYLKNNQHIINCDVLSYNKGIIELDVVNYSLCISAFTKMVYHL
jgi:hypothetical protein